jgi:hypothetical protein
MSQAFARHQLQVKLTAEGASSDMATKEGTVTYLVRAGDVQVGPVTLDQLQRGLKAGKIPQRAEAKAMDADDWKPVASIAVVLPPPKLPRRLKRPEPSWSAFQDGEPVDADGAPPLSVKGIESLGGPTKTFSRPMYLVFVAGSMDPPAGPFRAAALRAQFDSGALPPDALVCLVDEYARWVPVASVFDG